MKMISAGGAALPTDYGNFINNCKAGICKKLYNVPVTSFGDIQLYVDFGLTAPSTQVFTVIDACTPGITDATTPANYVVGQDGNGRWYGVFKNFSTPATAFLSFVIVGDFDTGTWFSEQFEINSCDSLVKLKACYPELNILLGYDPNGIYYGLPQGGTALGNASVRYIHTAFVRSAKLRETANKLTLSQSLIRNFRTDLERIYTFECEGVPKFYKDELLAIYSRGVVDISGTKYLVEDVAFELPLDSEGDDDLWKPWCKFHSTTKLYFGCDESLCNDCCSPALISASMDESNLVVDFAPCTPTPSNGYRIRYRIAGSGGAYTIVTGGSSPISVAVDATKLYEGFLESDCGPDGLSDGVPFTSGCLALVDDGPIPVGPGGVFTVNVGLNDVINTLTPVFSIVSFDNTLIASCSIDAGTGLLTFTMVDFSDEISPVNAIVYQVCCGAECKQANVSIQAQATVNISGSMPGITVQSITGITGYTFPGPQADPFGVLTGFHSPISGEIAIHMTGTALFNGNVSAYRDGTLIHCVNFLAGSSGGDLSLGTNLFTSAQKLVIAVNIGTC